jgi:hypothetical protein
MSGVAVSGVAKAQILGAASAGNAGRDPTEGMTWANS